MAYDLGVTAGQRYIRPVYSGTGGVVTINRIGGDNYYYHKFYTVGTFTNTSPVPLPIELVDENNNVVNTVTVPPGESYTVSDTAAASFTVHTFTSSGVFTPSSSIANVSVLSVAGGGGGGYGRTGNHVGGGGGAGGVRYYENLDISAGAKTITVGAGGPTWTIGNNTSVTGFPVSVINPTGGGKGGGDGGADYPNAGGIGPTSGGNGGSGGGASAGYTGLTGGTGIAGEGFAGVNGGGGAGAIGGLTSGSPSVGGPGGVGRQLSITGASTYYGGGGGGPGVTQGQGGLGGGGRGGKDNGTTDPADLATPGTPNTGGGGGGGSPPNSKIGAPGGSGIVIVKYQTSLGSASGGVITSIIEQAPLTVRYLAPSSNDPEPNFKNTTLLLSTDKTTTFVDDASSNNFSVSPLGNTRPDDLNPYSEDYPSNLNGSGYFNGTTDYLSIADNAAFQITGDFTFEAWVYQTSSKLVTVIGQWPSPGPTSFIFRIESTGQLSFAYNISGELNGTASTSSITYNTWNHVVWTRSGTTFKYFINGIQDATTVSLNGAFVNSAGPVLIGLYNTSVNTYFNGYISNARFVNGTAVYTSNFTPSTRPLIAIPNTVLLTLQTNVPANNKTFRDTSASNAMITSVGTVTQGNASPYGQGWSAYFDGTGDYIELVGSGPDVRNLGSFTIEGWYYPTSSAAVFRAIYSNLGGYGTAGRLYQYGTTLYFYWGANATFSVTGSIGWTLNAWNHFAVTWDGTTTKVYVNGQQTISTTLPVYSQVTDLTIGDGTYSPMGYISDFRVVASVVYNGPFTVPPSRLSIIPNTQMLTLQSGSFSDATLASGTKSATVSLTSNKSIYLSQTGSDSYLTVSNPNLALGATEFTIEFWVYPTADWSFGGDTIDYPIRSNGSTQQWAFDFGRSGYISTLTWWSRALDSGQNYRAYGYLLGTERPANWLNNWHHIAVTRRITTSSVYTYYFDGVSVGTYTHPGTGDFSTDTDLTINRNVVGYLRDIRITKSLVYTGNFTLPTGPLPVLDNTVLLINVGEVGGVEVPKDYSTNSIAVTVVNGTTPFTYLSSFPYESPALGVGTFDIIPYGNTSIRKFSPYQTPGYNSLINSGSMYFNGTTDYLDVAHKPEHVIGTSNFTIEAWVYPLSFSIVRTILSSAPSSATGAYYFGIDSASGFLTFNFSNSPIYTGTESVKLNSWNHVSVTRNEGILYFWINGRLDGSVVFTNSIDVAGGLRVGTGRGTPSNFFSGYISDLRLIVGTALYVGQSVEPLTAIENTVLLTARSSNLIDNSTYENTISGDTPISTSNPFSTSNSDDGYFSYSFNGTGNQVLSVANTSTLNFGSNDFTIEAWIYPTTVDGENVIASLYGYSNNRRSWYLGVRNGEILFRVGTGNGASILYSNTAILPNTWYFISATKQGTTARIYINSRLDATDFGVAETVYNNTVDPIYIGAVGPSLTGYYSGLISNLRILNGTARIPDANVTNSFSVPQSPAKAETNTVLLLNGTNGAVVDRAGRNDIITVGEAKLQRPPAGGYYPDSKCVMYFDGNGDYLMIPNSSSVTLGSGPWTIECWVNPTGDYSVFRTIFAKRVSGTVTTAFEGYLQQTTGVIGFYNGSQFVSTTVLQQNAWSHCAWVYNGTNILIFVNGVSVLNTAVTITENTEPFLIGGARGYAEWFAGYLGDFRITKGVERYTSNFIVPRAPFPTR